MPQNPYLFVVGCPRSGTTLLQRMLDAHPQLAVSNDPHFIHHGAGNRDRDVRLTSQIIERVCSYQTLRRLGLSGEAVRTAADGATTYSEFVSAVYATFAAERGKALAGEKTPRYVRYLPLLQALFPWARVLHVIRDGRDVALSILDWARPDRGPGRFRLWQEQPIAVCALWWRWHVTTGQRDGSAPGSSLYQEVRLEGLAANPESVLRRIASFLGLPFSDEMLTFHEGRMQSGPGLDSKDRWLPPTVGLRDWRRQIESDELELFEAIAGDLLSALGYERGCESIRPHTLELAEDCRSRWEAEVKARRRPASRLEFGISPLEYAGLA